MNSGPRIGLQLLVLAGIAAAILFVVRITLGQIFLEKTLQHLVAPVGLVWGGFLLVVYFARVYRFNFLFGLSLFFWILLTIAGNGFVSNQLIRFLEADYLEDNLVNCGEMDAVIVLGGGTMTGANGQEQLGASGDRIATAARLYHAGKTNLIICTGQHALKQSNRGLDPGESAKLLLMQMGVDEDQLVVIGGQNTGEEMVELKDFLDDKAFTSVGLITSAWHMKRAMRLADQQGLSLEPVPSNYRSRLDYANPGWVIPGADALRNSHVAVKEWLAGLASR